jgi:hypothetical protein
VWAIAGYLIVAALSAAALVALVGKEPPREHPSPWDLADVARKLVTVQSSLSGFAVTSLVLLVTLARDQAGAPSREFNATAAMFIAAYMSYISAALMWANMVNTREVAEFDLQRAQFSLASHQTYRSIFLGWFALSPLLETFRLDLLADLMGVALLVVVLGGWTAAGSPLYRLGDIRGRTLLLTPALAFVGTLIYAAAISVTAPETRSPDSAMYLTGAMFTLNFLTFGLFSVLPALVLRPSTAFLLRQRWHVVSAVHAQGTVVLLAFFWLAVVGVI